ncbi:type VI secretion system contractile sheath small subunit, partial [Cronobacter sakazakii]|nr:type VI secretion system contractile sheath small subunit [Cronobacter sakazakii]
PALNLAVENTLAGDGREENVRLTFRQMKDFEPEQVARQIPQLKAMLAMRNLLRDLKSNLLDNATFRRELEAVSSFLDIFGHRIATQYYRIWRKYAYPATFEPGGTDATSQCLLGLVGLGIPGTAEHIATPVSRFLALLGAMRLPTRNTEGIPGA